MSSKEFETLTLKYFSQSISEQELKNLSKELTNVSNQLLFKELARVNYLIHSSGKTTEIEIEEILNKTIRKRNVFRQKRAHLLKYVALFVGFFGLGYVYFNNTITDSKVFVNNIAQQTKILPGNNKAILTLGDGSSIYLNKGQDYESKNIKSNGELIVYDTKDIDEKISYNTLTIPRGGQFTLKLSDGTQVWLNSESQIKYPDKFVSGEVRKVELLYGEAFFEVSPSSLHFGDGFQVFMQEQKIDVLGTVFNVRAYAFEDQIRTTLVEGSVQIQTPNSSKILKPKEQSVFDKEQATIVIQKVPVLFDEIAWKQGYFSFKGKTLDELMKTLSRWYDVEYVFVNPEKENLRFSGVLERESTIDELLTYIEKTNEIQFKIEGRSVRIY